MLRGRVLNNLFHISQGYATAPEFEGKRSHSNSNITFAAAVDDDDDDDNNDDHNTNDTITISLRKLTMDK